MGKPRALWQQPVTQQQKAKNMRAINGCIQWAEIPAAIEDTNLTLARQVVAATGPASQASDVGTLRLAFAQANAELLGAGGCQCGGRVVGCQEVYFRRPNGSHGWMCCTCRKITQTG